MNIATLVSLVMISFLPQSDSQLEAELTKMWQAQDEEIVNGKLEIILYRAAEVNIPISGVSDAEQLFNSVDGIDSKESLLSLMQDEWLPRFENNSVGYKRDSSIWNTKIDVIFDLFHFPMRSFLGTASLIVTQLL